MAEPTLGVKLPMTDEPAQQALRKSAGDWGRFAERHGFDSVWASEGWGADVFVTLSEIVCQTNEIKVGSAIANVYSRSPAVLAMAATSLDRLSDGRTILGVGASHPGTVEKLHGQPYKRPIRRTHEAIEVIKQLTRDGNTHVEYSGEVFQIGGYPSINRPIPIYNGALGDANLRVTGRLADGWLPHLIPFSRYEHEFEKIAVAAHEAGREPDDIVVRPQVLAAVSSDPAYARNLIRRFIANYIGRKEAYRNKISEAFPDQAARIAEAWHSGSPDTAVSHVTDEMVDELGVAGDPNSARDRLRELLSNTTIDHPIIFVPKQADYELLEQTLEELSPAQL